MQEIHRILLTNARTPPETKYVSKPPLTEASYTKYNQKYHKGYFWHFGKLLGTPGNSLGYHGHPSLIDEAQSLSLRR